MLVTKKNQVFDDDFDATVKRKSRTRRQRQKFSFIHFIPIKVLNNIKKGSRKRQGFEIYNNHACKLCKSNLVFHKRLGLRIHSVNCHDQSFTPRVRHEKNCSDADDDNAEKVKEHAEDMSVSFGPDECSWMEEFPLFQPKIVLSNNLNVKMAESEKRKSSSRYLISKRTRHCEAYKEAAEDEDNDEVQIVAEVHNNNDDREKDLESVHM